VTGTHQADGDRDLVRHATTAGDYGGAERHLVVARDIFRRAGGRWGSRAPFGGRPTSRSHAGVSTKRRPRCSKPARCSRRRSSGSANTLAGLPEVAVLHGDAERASALLADTRHRYAARDDALGVAEVEERLRGVAKDPLSPGKAAPDRTTCTPKTKGRRR